MRARRTETRVPQWAMPVTPGAAGATGAPSAAPASPWPAPAAIPRFGDDDAERGEVRRQRETEEADAMLRAARADGERAAWDAK